MRYVAGGVLTLARELGVERTVRPLFDFAPVYATIVGDDVERATMVQIKPRKSKPGGSEI